MTEHLEEWKLRVLPTWQPACQLRVQNKNCVRGLTSRRRLPGMPLSYYLQSVSLVHKTLPPLEVPSFTHFLLHSFGALNLTCREHTIGHKARDGEQ